MGETKNSRYKYIYQANRKYAKLLVLVSVFGHRLQLIAMVSFFLNLFSNLPSFSKNLSWLGFFTWWSDPNLHS